MDEARRTRLRRHLRLIDDGVAPVVQAYQAQIECQAGCSDCCHQTFRVSRVEGELLREGLALLSEAERADVLHRAARYQPDAREPCPLLSDSGRCRAYEHRPRICRKYGIVLWNPEDPSRVTTCPKNFRESVDIDPKLIVEPQAEWARDWIRLRDELGGAPTANAPIAQHLLASLPDPMPGGSSGA